MLLAGLLYHDPRDPQGWLSPAESLTAWLESMNPTNTGATLMQFWLTS